MYFNEFPVRYYEIDGKTYLIPDITKRVKFKDEVMQHITLFEEYAISDTDTPRKIADRIYGNADHEWIIFIINEIHDFFTDWPLTVDQITGHVVDIYTDLEVHGVHHYENGLGETVSSNASGAKPVSNYEYESRENDKKRSIRLLSPEYLDDFLSEFRELMQFEVEE